ncbi:MAG: chromosome segregation protein SMC, partial [Nitrospirae bacterium]|nr:chromosome segregation protein SMC [Nitrospirota bacterium]
MRIEKIELIGFKSFSERTAFNLHPGITCIVGPNGCGKSNVVDAFRWALGEQSAKSLRGEKMEEVIFNGSSTKKPKGMAEVTLAVSGMGDPTQDNGNDPQNFTSVTRRLYRSGESEYMANKSVCRLKDIKDLFLDTGLEVKSYSILEQDRIAAVLNSKPQDRRFIIEEVAGVMKYKVRKTEAQNKLESSRLNLQRINDIVLEVKRQINALDRQAKKAERYKKLSAEMRTIELKIAKRDYQTLRESLERILAEYTALKENEAMKKAELTKIENISETNRLGIFEKEKSLEIIQQEFRDAEKAIAETERVIAVLNTDRDNLKEYLAKLFTQREEFETKRNELSEKLGELNGTEARLSVDIEGLKEELRLKNELIESVENELSEKESAVDSKRRNVFSASEELSALRNETGRMQASLEALERKEVSLIKDADDSKKVLGEIDLSIRDVEGSLRDRNAEVLLLSEKKGVYTAEVSSLREKIEHLRDELSKTKEDLASNISRMGSLKELVLDAPTREILQDGPNLHIVSSLSDILNVEPEYEKAVENALSEKINSFILKSLADIEVAISILKTKGSGRMSFIPLDSRTSDELSDVPAGIIGRAVDFVRVDAEFAGIAKNLLKNIFIVKDLRTAIALRESGNNYFFVTLDGEIVEPSGAVIGGEGRGVLKRKRELREIEELIGQKTDSISGLQEDLNRLQQELSEKESGIRDIETAVVNAEKEMSLSKLTSANYQEEKERTDRKLAYLSIEVEEIVREKESLKNMISEKEKAISAGESEKSAIEKDMADLLEEIIQKKMRYEEDRSHITDLRLSITAHKEKIEAVQKEIEAANNATEELLQKDNSLNGEIKSVEDRISQREAESGENEEKVKGMVLNADRLRDDIS